MHVGLVREMELMSDSRLQRNKISETLEVGGASAGHGGWCLRIGVVKA